MPQARKSQISLSDTPYYHCVSRCVRRSFLCGEDNYSGKSFEHRRAWVEQRLFLLAEIFAVDLCAYAVMSNHTHVVLHVNANKAKEWSQQEVIERWHRLHKGTSLSRLWIDSDKRHYLTQIELDTVAQSCEQWRQRLYSISWFMRSLNEYIARKANQEDDCRGRFWEGRFKSQALLDEASLAACMAYVDLNPVRANIAPTPEQSDFTSIQKRVAQARIGTQPSQLFPFVGHAKDPIPRGLPFRLSDYLQLVEVSSHSPKHQNQNGNSLEFATILKKLNLDQQNWHILVRSFEQHFRGAVGQEHLLRRFHQSVGHRRTPNLRQSRQLLSFG